MSSAKKRIQIAITVGDVGGAQTFVAGFARYLKDLGHEVEVLVGDGGWLAKTLEASGVTCRRLRWMKREISPIHDVLAILELGQAMRRFKPDAVHLNSSKMGFVGSLAARLARVPNAVYRIGGWVFLEAISPRKKNLYRWIERTSARWKDTIICVHPGDMDVAKQEGIVPRKQLLAVPNGIDLTRFDAEIFPCDQSRADLGLPRQAFVFGSIAGFYPPKELPAYLEACAVIHAEFPDARFFIIGDGPERAAIEAKRQALKLEDTVRLVGNRERAFRSLKAADAFVLPSSKEGMPWALLEAMAVPLPCIVTDVGANRWMLEDGGWVVPPLKTDALVSAMREVLQNPDERKRRAEMARRQVESRFPLARTYEQNAAALLDSLLA